MLILRKPQPHQKGPDRWATGCPGLSWHGQVGGCFRPMEPANGHSFLNRSILPRIDRKCQSAIERLRGHQRWGIAWASSSVRYSQSDVGRYARRRPFDCQDDQPTPGGAASRYDPQCWHPSVGRGRRIFRATVSRPTDRWRRSTATQLREFPLRCRAHWRRRTLRFRYINKLGDVLVPGRD
jgi:hypothetical protein